MVEPADASEFHLWGVADIAGVEPRNYVFKKQALNNRLSKVKQVIHGENSLYEIVFPRRKVFRGGVYFKGFAVHPNAEAIQRHFQEVLTLFRVEIAAGRFEVVNGVARSYENGVLMPPMPSTLGKAWHG